MKVQKIINTTEEINLDIKGITLLSIEEYKDCRDMIKPTGFIWWLRSPGDSAYDAAFVYGGGYLSFNGIYVGNDFTAVRPALKINPQSSNLRIGDKVEWANHSWTVISGDLILCDEIIAERSFRRDWRADDANDYEKSDIKQWLENWLAKQMESDNE